MQTLISLNLRMQCILLFPKHEIRVKSVHHVNRNLSYVMTKTQVEFAACFLVCRSVTTHKNINLWNPPVAEDWRNPFPCREFLKHLSCWTKLSYFLSFFRWGKLDVKESNDASQTIQLPEKAFNYLSQCRMVHHFKKNDLNCVMSVLLFNWANVHRRYGKFLKNRHVNP